VTRALAAAAIAALAQAPFALAAPRCGSLLHLPPAAPAGQQVLFGHIRSLVRDGRYYRLRFSPAFFLTGLPAEEAALAATGSRDVPNDNIAVDSGKVFVYDVLPAARVTVLTGTRPCTSPSTVAKLATLVRKGPGLGFWIRVSEKYPSPVLELDQQYFP
jgi:hypothetical protein